MSTNIGRRLYGYCGGEFGRDSYGNKRIEAEGVDWIVARDGGDHPVFAHFKDETEKQGFIDCYKTQPPDNDDDT